MNFSGQNYDFISFSARKTTKDQINVQVANEKPTRLMRYHSAQDPCIGLGYYPAGERMSQPCYAEYGMSKYIQEHRDNAPNVHPEHKRALIENPRAFNRIDGEVLKFTGDQKHAIKRTEIWSDLRIKVK